MSGGFLDFIIIPETAKVWGIAPRTIRYHIATVGIDGGEQKGKIWLIPDSKPKPKNLRFNINRKDVKGQEKCWIW